MNDYLNLKDVWSLKAKPMSSSTPACPQVARIEGIEPLGDQFGVYPLRCVPDGLDNLLFGAIDNLDLKTYTILDAAKVPNLLEMLEDSGLEYRCLFKGKAFNDMKGVAPYLVRLTDDNQLTRNLFTRSDAQWHMWDNVPGVYLRSDAQIDQLLNHFRKFTKIQSETGKWFYFRFWEPVFVKSAAAFESYFTRQFFEKVFCDGVILCMENEAIQIESSQRFESIDSKLEFVSMELEIIYALMVRAEFTTTVRNIPQNHWVLPVLARILIQNMLSSNQLAKLIEIRAGTTAQMMAMSFISNRRVGQTGRTQALRHLLRKV